MYWQWSVDKVHAAAEAQMMVSRWGWRIHIGPGTSQRTLKNHPIQTMGAHILHFAGIGLTESGIKVCCPVHDAVMTECRIPEVEAHVQLVQEIMRQAAKSALGIEIPVDSKVVRYPDRYMDKRGQAMFDKAIRALEDTGKEISYDRKGDIGISGYVKERKSLSLRTRYPMPLARSGKIGRS